MVTFIFALVLGISLALFATQNTAGASLNLYSYPLSNIPLYLIVFGSMLLGVIISLIFNLVDAVGSFFTIQGKNSQIRATAKTNEDLRRSIHDLEIENARLRGEKADVVRQAETKEEDHVRPYRPSWFDRFKNGLTW